MNKMQMLRERLAQDIALARESLGDNRELHSQNIRNILDVLSKLDPSKVESLVLLVATEDPGLATAPGELHIDVHLSLIGSPASAETMFEMMQVDLEQTLDCQCPSCVARRSGVAARSDDVDMDELLRFLMPSAKTNYN